MLSICGCGDTAISETSDKLLSTDIGSNGSEFEDPYKETRKNVIKINFQPSNSEPIEDYFIDSGLPFGKRKGGLSYGWSQDVSIGAKKRNNFTSFDERFDTLVIMSQKLLKIDSQWQIALANGSYDITLVAGDPTYSKGSQAIKLNGQLLFDKKQNEYGFIKHQAKVYINQGKLTLTPAKKFDNYIPKLNFIEISPSHIRKKQLAPTSIANIKNLNLHQKQFFHWKNPLFQFDRNYLIHAQVPLTNSLHSIKQLPSGTTLVENLEKAENVLIDSEKSGFYYIVSANSQGYLSPPVLLPRLDSITPLPKHELKTNLVKAMEVVRRWSNNEDIFQLHNLFSQHLFTHQVLGSDYKLQPDSLWLHRSMNSAVIALQLEKAGKTYIEYWNDKERFVSSKPIRDYYTQLHYLSNLTPNSAYEFNVYHDNNGEKTSVYQGSLRTYDQQRVTLIRQPKNPALPVELNEANTKYVLTSDMEFTNQGLIISANNIELDLNGFSVKQLGYDESTTLMPLITANRGLSNTKIVNGKLIQATKGNNQKKRLLLVDNVKRAEVAGVTVEYSLPQTEGITMESRLESLAPFTHYAHHNQLIDKGWQITNRHGNGGGVAIKMGTHFGYLKSDVHASYNLVARSRQNGIQFASYMNSNEIYIDSWSTNSFAIQPFGKPNQTSGRFINNKLFLTGYHSIGFSWGVNDLLVENNYIEMQGINSGRNRWWEDFGDQNSLNGLRITNYGKGGQVKNNLKYYNNKIIGMARNGSMMRGTELFSDYSISGTEVRWSEIDVRAEDNDSVNVSAVVTQGTGNDNHQPTFYRDSILRSNVAIVRFGDSYGRGDNHMFENVTFEKVRGNNNFATFVFDGAFMSTGHQIIDGTFTNGAKWDDVFWRRTSSASYFQVVNNKQRTRKTVRALEWTPELTVFPEVKNRRQTQAITEIY